MIKIEVWKIIKWTESKFRYWKAVIKGTPRQTPLTELAGRWYIAKLDISVGLAIF